jgi:hypothetical protein
MFLPSLSALRDACHSSSLQLREKKEKKMFLKLVDDDESTTRLSSMMHDE